MEIAILGSRGIPAEFGGFETFAEQLAVRLVKRACRVTVFCEGSQGYQPAEYKGVRLRYVRTPKIAGLRSVWSDLVAMSMCLRGYDAVYMLGYHTAVGFFLPRMFGVNFFVNMDGLEWRRAKWKRFARAYLKISEWLAMRWSANLVADSGAINDYLSAAYPGNAHKLHTIPYGAEIPAEVAGDVVTEWGLTPCHYDLVVCRLEPENHVLEIIKGHTASDSDRLLVVIGDHQSGSDYVAELRSIAGDGVRFLGTVFDQNKLNAIRQHCRAYLHGHSVGGTNPSLLEAMSCGSCVIAHDNPFNREVLANQGIYFHNAEDVAAQVAALDARGVPPQLGTALKERIRNVYDWERITDLYLQRFSAICST
jgi:glycosyltransferase involved in cell wall biosynthesis